MSSLTTINLNSDSESDDADFVPESNKYSDDSGSDTEIHKVSKSQKNKVNPKRKGGICLDDDIPDVSNNEDSRKEEFEQEKTERNEIEKEKKIDDLWASFKKDTTKNDIKLKATTANKNKISGGLGQFGSMSNSKKTKPKSSAVKKSQPKDIMSSIFGGFEYKSTDKEKSNCVSHPSVTTTNPKSIISTIFEASGDSSNIDVDQAVLNKSTVCKNIESEVETNSMGNEKKITVTKTYDFAGEAVEVTKQVDKDSKEGKQFLKQEKQQGSDKLANCDSVNKRGLSSIMGVISGKKPKLGCLDKSKMDWNKFVSEEGIKEELQTHNKGKEGYVEKQMFLERADYRRFEIEREAREKTRKPLNK